MTKQLKTTKSLKEIANTMAGAYMNWDDNAPVTKYEGIIEIQDSQYKDEGDVWHSKYKIKITKKDGTQVYYRPLYSKGPK